MTATALRAERASVVVPVGGAALGLEVCLRALRRLDPAPGQLIVVLDGRDAAPGPLQRTALEEAQEALGDRLQLLHHQPRGGPAAARNVGARAATGEFLFFLDADVEPPSDLLARAERIWQQEPQLDAVIGSYDDSPAAPGVVSRFRNLLHHHTHQQGNREASTFWGACGVVRRRAFESVGGFDEGFTKPSIEDIDLGARLVAAGKSMALEPALQVKHLKRWTWVDMVRTDLFRRAIPWTVLMLEGSGMVDDLNVKWGERLAVASACLLLLGLLVAPFWPPALLLALALLMLLLIQHRSLYRLFWRRGGVLFSVASVLLHLQYLWLCAVGFVAGVLVTGWRRIRSER